ncbi:uncharacterized protein PAE49_020124 isoform 2-T3 [Odontesthes bonariensis]|uniref:uncharacterized protein LOC142368084 isoform X2 n=1 Tax=Odontesthes bonariensis TaxID=219752 RepID=UPI003F58922C
MHPSKEKTVDKPTWEPSYQEAMSFLATTKRGGEKGLLKDPIMPKLKLVSSKVFECRCDKRDSVYLCEMCSQKITERDFSSHVSGSDHQKIQRVVVNLNEKTYSNILKQSFQSAIGTLRALNFRPRGVCKRPSTSAPHSVQPVNASAARHAHVNSVVDNIKVVNRKINDSGDGGTAINMSRTKTTRVPADSNEARTKTCMKRLQSADSFHAHPSVTSCGKQTLRVNVSTKGTNKVCLQPYFRGNDPKDVTPNTICKATNHRIKRSAVASVGMATTSSTRTGTTSTLSATSSKGASAAKSVAMSRPLKRASETASKANPASYNTARSTVVREATGRGAPSSRAENAPERASKASGASTVTSVAPAKMPKTSVKCGNVDLSAKTAQLKSSVSQIADIASHTRKRSPTAAPQLNTAMSARSEYKNPHKESSHVSAAKSTASASHLKVGLNQLIVVSWEGKRQVYCQLCSVRLKGSDHLISSSHQYNYVKRKYPGWTANLTELEGKLNNIVAHLAQVEQDVGSQSAQVKVKRDVYQKLALLPEDKAVETVKAMVRPRDPRLSSPTASIADVVRQDAEVSSSNDGVRVSCNEVLKLNNQTDQENKKLHQPVQRKEMESNSKREAILSKSEPHRFPRVQSLDGEDARACDLIQDRLQSSRSVAKSHAEPVPAPCSQAEDKLAVKLEKAHGCTQRLINPNCRQQWKSDPPSQNQTKDRESTPKFSPVQSRGPQLQAAALNTGQENQSGPSHKAEQAPKQSPGPGEHRGSQMLTRTSIGGKTHEKSHLSFYLKASLQDTKPVIEMEPDSKREVILGARQFPKVQSSGGEDTRACDLIQDRLQSSRSVAKSHAEPVPAPCSQAEDKLAVKLEKAHGCTQRLINPNCRQQWKSDPPSQNQTKDRESTPKFSPVQSRSPQLQAAALNTGQENQSGPSHKAEQAPKQSPGPGEHRGSQMLTRTSIGGKTQGCSHLSFYLKASLQDTKPVIGMGSVWECRGMSLETFFLCESCEEILSRREICRHMVTHDHQLKYTWKEHPKFLQMFWFEEDLLLEMKMSILKDVVQELSQRERFYKVDAQCILLGPELHDFVRTTSFGEALKMVQNIKNEEKPSIFCLPINTTHHQSHQPETRQSRPPEGQLAQAFETDQRRDLETGQKETSPSEETARVGDLGVVKDRRSPLGVTFTFTKAEPVVSPVPAVGTHFNSPETCSGLSLQAEVKPAVSQLQRPDPLLQVKQEEVGSTYVPTAGPTISQNLEVSPQNECPPTRKRRADMSVETLSRTLTSSSSLPAKYAPNPVQVKSEPSSPPISESPSVDPAVNSTLLHLKEEDTEPKQNQPTKKWKLFADQSSALKISDFKVNLSPSRSAPDNTETKNFWATDSSETVESRWDSKTFKTKYEAPINKNRWDSKCLIVKATVQKKPLSNLVERIKKEAPV